MGLIYYLSSISGHRLPHLMNGFDKLIHFLIYAILSALIYLSLNKTGLKRYLILQSFLFTVIYGISDEIHQLYVPLRDASIGDMIADSFGAFLGSYLVSRFG
ncbi:MAG: hypothetical protein Fur0020_08560 [Thermodesulfovibrionia bacterium]